MKMARKVMAKPEFHTDLIDRLPVVRGRLTENAPIGQTTWFRVGGPAEVLFKPKDLEDLRSFLAGCPDNVPITVIGVASNLLIRDGGIPGVVIRLGRDFSSIDLEDNNKIKAGALALDVNVAKVAAESGVGGLEFLSGIPGTIGGALRMNAGSYGSELVDVLEVADVLDRDGQMHHLTPKDMNMTYRHNDIPENMIFVGCTLKGMPEEPHIIQARMDKIKMSRAESQPIKSQTGGSTFANPSVDDPSITKKSWELIDEAGCRGMQIGGAQMSEQHCNFMINTGTATAADLERLGETVRERVLETSGVNLRWEIRLIGVPLPKDGDLFDKELKGTA